MLTSPFCDLVDNFAVTGNRIMSFQTLNLKLFLSWLVGFCALTVSIITTTQSKKVKRTVSNLMQPLMLTHLTKLACSQMNGRQVVEG